MKIIKTASGKKNLKMSKSEWETIGKTAGWHGDDGYVPDEPGKYYPDEESQVYNGLNEEQSEILSDTVWDVAEAIDALDWHTYTVDKGESIDFIFKAVVRRNQQRPDDEFDIKYKDPRIAIAVFNFIEGQPFTNIKTGAYDKNHLIEIIFKSELRKDAVSLTHLSEDEYEKKYKDYEDELINIRDRNSVIDTEPEEMEITSKINEKIKHKKEAKKELIKALRNIK